MTKLTKTHPRPFFLVQLLLLFSVLPLLSCQQKVSISLYASDLTSMISVIAHPEAYHGKEISMVGVLRLEFEGHILFFSSEDARHGIIHNALWLRLTEEQEALFDPHANFYVVVKGTFDANDHGHLGSYMGAIAKVESIRKLPTSTEPAVPPSLLRPLEPESGETPSSFTGET